MFKARPLSIEVNPLNCAFAAEIVGADLREPPTPELMALVEDAVAEHAVVAIRDQHLDDEQHIRFSRAFGPLELPPNLGLAGVKKRLRRELYDASNLDENGRLLGEASLRRRYNRGNELFHTDSSFNDLPTKWSLLLGHVLPPEGGQTQFVDMRIVYDELAPALKADLEGLTAEHWLWYSRQQTGLNDVTDEMRRLMPPVHHPVVRTMPYGRKTLYIGAHASHIVGRPEEEGRALLQELYAFATQPKFIYGHEWRAGDLVIWDNRCTMHRAGEFDDLRYPRDMRRTTVNEHGPEMASTDGRG